MVLHSYVSAFVILTPSLAQSQGPYPPKKKEIEGAPKFSELWSVWCPSFSELWSGLSELWLGFSKFWYGFSELRSGFSELWGRAVCVQIKNKKSSQSFGMGSQSSGPGSQSFGVGPFVCKLRSKKALRALAWVLRALVRVLRALPWVLRALGVSRAKPLRSRPLPSQRFAGSYAGAAACALAKVRRRTS